MESKKKILFVVNPKSGTKSIGKRQLIIDLVLHFAQAIFEVQVAQTTHVGHATQLTQQAVLQGIDYVVAVGGDGTVNEVAQALIDTNTALGILPLGSGNGLARHLGIPMQPEKALQVIFKERVFAIDACFVNNLPFFCTAGVGFDAFVAHRFAQQKSRGLQTYARTTIQSFWKFKPDTYQLQLDDQSLSNKSFAITFANASQYGNNAFVAPNAKINDGWLDVCLLSPFPAALAPSIGLRLFQRTLPRSKFVEVIKAKEITLRAPSPLLIHFDGEPKQLKTNELQVSIRQQCLKVLV